MYARAEHFSGGLDKFLIALGKAALSAEARSGRMRKYRGAEAKRERMLIGAAGRVLTRLPGIDRAWRRAFFEPAREWEGRAFFRRWTLVFRGWRLRLLSYFGPRWNLVDVWNFVVCLYDIGASCFSMEVNVTRGKYRPCTTYGGRGVREEGVIHLCDTYLKQTRKEK